MRLIESCKKATRSTSRVFRVDQRGQRRVCNAKGRKDLVTSGVNLQLPGYFAILNTTLHFLVISLGYIFTFPRGRLSPVDVSRYCGHFK